MTDREQAIATLTKHLDHWKRLLSEGICCEVEGKETIDALEFAIESIKVDRAYDLAYEKVDFIEIPEGASNGDVFRLAYPNVAMVHDIREKKRLSVFADDWWNSPYRKENNNG